jgi:uncharacterized paraquat-inducible protein A
MKMRLIDADKGLISKIQRKTGCNFITAQEIVDSMSTVEERKVGKWIYHEKSISTGFKDLRECSCCHCYFRWEMPRNSYCPNCGADMRGCENGSN